MRRRFVAIAVLAATCLAAFRPSLAQTPTYRLPDHLWPSPTRILKAAIPANAHLPRGPYHHSPGLGKLGRVDGQGFVEETVWTPISTEASRCGRARKPCEKKVRHSVSFTYLVSVFPSIKGAADALHNGIDAFGDAAKRTFGLSTRIGDQMYAFPLRTTASRYGILAIQRGAVLVEMYDRTRATDSEYRDRGLRLLDTVIGRWLDHQAIVAQQHPPSPTQTPPASTPTATAKPTHTAIPTATRTQAAHVPVALDVSGAGTDGSRCSASSPCATLKVAPVRIHS